MRSDVPSPGYLACLALTALVLLIAPRVSAQSTSRPVVNAPTTSPSSEFEITEWFILNCDASQRRVNGLRIDNTLPLFVDTLRNSKPDSQNNQPAPIGVIRFSGRSSRPISMRLKSPRSIFRGTWPPAAMRPGEAEWADLELSPNSVYMRPLEPDHWFNALRNSTSPYVVFHYNSERFLLYDLELALAVQLKITGGATPDEPLDVVNTGWAPLTDLVLYSHNESGWRSAAFSEPLNPATAPSDSSDLQFHPVSSSDPIEFLGEWKKRLAPWKLEAADLDLIVRTLAVHALDLHQTTAVYLLDDAQMNQLIPIRIDPPPRAVRRVGIVIARNIDPNLSAKIEQLITQLGDNNWKKREAASRALLEIGYPAESRLRSAMQNPDLEIAVRAADIVASFSKVRQ